MRTRIDLVSQGGHYDNLRYSRIPRLMGVPVVDGVPVHDVSSYCTATLTNARNTITDEKHSKQYYSFAGWDGKLWDTGDCLLSKTKNVAMSDATMSQYRTYTNLAYFYSGWGEVRFNEQNILAHCHPTQSDFELLERSKPAQESMSLPNFLFEFKDLKQMADIMDVGRIAKSFKRIGRQWKHGTGWFKGSAKELAGQNLNYQFGILPTAMDIDRFIQSLLDCDEEIEKLKRESGKLLTRRSSCDLDCTWDDNNMYFNHGSRSLTPTLAKSSFTPVMKGRRRCISRWVYNMPDFSHLSHLAMDSELRLRLLGLRGFSSGSFSWKKIWNAIPWSWCMDWIFNIQSVMGRDTVVPVHCFDVCFIDEIDISFSNFDVVWECPIDTNIFTSQAPGMQNSANPEVKISNRVYRDPNDPNLQFEGISLNGLTPKQLSLLTSIGISSKRGVAKR